MTWGERGEQEVSDPRRRENGRSVTRGDGRKDQERTDASGSLIEVKRSC